jgi:hypothetical protein
MKAAAKIAEPTVHIASTPLRAINVSAIRPAIGVERTRTN